MGFPYGQTLTRVRPGAIDRHGDPIPPSSSDEVQTVTVTGAPTGGTFTLTYSGQTTIAVACDASAAAVQNALVALSNVGSTDVLVTGPAGGPYAVTFGGELAATDVPQMTAAAALTGGTSPSVAVVTQTGGVVPTGGPTELDVPGCVVWPTDGNGSGGNEQTDRADTVVWGYTVSLPPDTDVRPTDRWRYADALFEQVGEAGRFLNAYTGTRVLTIVLRRVTG